MKNRWSEIARNLFRDDTHETGVPSNTHADVRKTDSNVAFFFVSYMLINSIMLLNVVVAVLLVPLCVCVCVRVCVCVCTYMHTHAHTGRVHFERDVRKGGGGASNARGAGQT